MSERLLLLAALILFALPVLAQPEGPCGPPPQEAIDACADQEEGTLCAFEARHGTLEGTCRRPPGAELACVPHDGPPRRP